MSNGLRVGIAGYGLAGRYFHAPLLKGVGFEVVGALTSNTERITHLHHDFPDAKSVSTIDELLALKIDLLVVASANLVHAEQAIAGLRAGVPVVVDKPMGLNLAQTEEIIQVSQETGVPVTTYFNRRWDSESLTIKRVLSEGLLGEIFRLDSRFERFRPEGNPHSWRVHDLRRRWRKVARLTAAFDLTCIGLVRTRATQICLCSLDSQHGRR